MGCKKINDPQYFYPSVSTSLWCQYEQLQVNIKVEEHYYMSSTQAFIELLFNCCKGVQNSFYGIPIYLKSPGSGIFLK